MLYRMFSFLFARIGQLPIASGETLGYHKRYLGGVLLCRNDPKGRFPLLTASITARNNERIKSARALSLAKERRARGLHLVEGEKLDKQPDAEATFINKEEEVIAQYPGVVELE